MVNITKGTLSNFEFSKLPDLTIDERRLVRKSIQSILIDEKQSVEVFLTEMLKESTISEAELQLVITAAIEIKQFFEIFSLIIQESENNKQYSREGIARVVNTIREFPVPLKFNLEELELLFEKQKTLPEKLVRLFEKTNQAKTLSDLQQIGQDGFEIIKDLANSPTNIMPEKKISEAEKIHAIDMFEQFGKGYIFKKTMEEELKKIPFTDILNRQSKDLQRMFYDTEDSLRKIQDGIVICYALNWKQILVIRRVYSILQEILSKKKNHL